MTYKAEIPYGAYWSTPFTRWQGSLSHLHSVEFAAHVAKAELARREIDAAAFDYGVLGFSVPQKQSFYGLPWLAGLVGAAKAGGPTLMQACATGARPAARSFSTTSRLLSATMHGTCRSASAAAMCWPTCP